MQGHLPVKYPADWSAKFWETANKNQIEDFLLFTDFFFFARKKLVLINSVISHKL